VMPPSPEPAKQYRPSSLSRTPTATATARLSRLLSSAALPKSSLSCTQYYVDEIVCINPAVPAPPAHVSPALHKTLNSALHATTRAPSAMRIATCWTGDRCRRTTQHPPYLASPMRQTPKCIFERPLNSDTKSEAITERIPPQTPASRISMDSDGPLLCAAGGRNRPI
jgi:hypothetical protein